MKIDVLARRWGGPDGGPDGMAVAAAYLAWTLAERGHQVRCYAGAAGAASWSHPLVEWRQRSPLLTPDDFSADLVITTITPAWRRTAADAARHGADGRLVFWHHHGTPPPGYGCIFAAPPAVNPSQGWRMKILLPPSSWAIEELDEGGKGTEILVPGASRGKGGPTALAVARGNPDLRFYVLPGRASEMELTPWRKLSNVEIADGFVIPSGFFERARVVFSPTRAEVHPLTLVEAAVRGIPIVCSDLPGTRAATAGEAWYLPTSAAPEEWGRRLRDALMREPRRLVLRPYREVVDEALEQLVKVEMLAQNLEPVAAAPARRLHPRRQAAAGVSRPAWQAPPRKGLPRVLVLADVPNWAWAAKARALKAHLGDRVDVTVAFSSDPATQRVIRAAQHDLYHTFEVCQLGTIPEGWPLVTGITAHVARNWDEKRGPGTVRRWADRAIGFHANSRMLQREMENYLGRSVYYVPNGVDEDFWIRTRPRSSARLVVGHVARPNPRKGGDLVREACERARVELRTIDRRAQNALSPEQMREFYQEIHVLAVSSDMDGTPNPALEAASCECVIVSNAIGNMPEFICPGENGIITPRSVDGLADALRRMDEMMPIADVIGMGTAARKTVLEGWTWARQAPAYAEMWERCLNLM